MAKYFGKQFETCGGCGMTFDPDNEFELAAMDTHDCDDAGYECDTCGTWVDKGEEHIDKECSM